MVSISREMSSGTSSNHANPQHQQQHQQQQHRPIRADTLDLKQKLAVALGPNGARYWQALVQFCKGNIDRSEFEALAHKSLKSEHVHLHNALILGILYNASADVPGPSSSRASRRVTRVLPDGTTVTEEEEEEPSRKRLRTLVAGLPRKERMRLINLEKSGKLGANSIGGVAGLGWAGSAADMLEKKRRDEEKRKVAEDRRKVRQFKSAIGARDWKGHAIDASHQIASVRGMLSFSTQQAVARALQQPLCVESKQLPDLESLKDRMTMLAVEAGMPGGVQPQAAAMVLCALQNHLQNVASSIITKVRANRPNGIQTNEPFRPAASAADYVDLDAILSSSAAYAPMAQSPSAVPLDLDENSIPPSSQSSPLRSHVRSLASDVSSSRTSASGIGTSFGDASMLSLASTAATSLAGPPSPSLKDTDSASQQQDSSFTNSSSADGEEHVGQHKLKRSHATMQGVHDDREDTYGRRFEPVAASSNRLTLSDMAFLLEVAPSTVVEPVGQGMQERLLASEWEDDEVLYAGQEQSPERLLARAARMAATAKVSDSVSVTLAAPSSAASTSIPGSRGPQTPASGVGGADAAAAGAEHESVRNRFVIDQMAPLRLLDRKSLAESAFRPTKGGLSLPEHKTPSVTSSASGIGVANVLADVNGRKKDTPAKDPAHLHNLPHNHRRDEIWDVVDPVALFGSLCD
ncbi:hypothetical protein BCV70DRAFT_209895 [Testicularia cyperi]|uniref:Uncharacterized protein n=1 Tax=Testicularia cyperi TaxID=1882483 RepID=A0A317XZD6_9BASI|nr:hypothetical protein BCV70DRAFT_209895 [Testicularia cyperi]